MSERKMVPKHFWTDRGRRYIADASGGGRIAAPLPAEEEAPAALPDLVAELHRKDGVSACVRELLRVVRERDEALARVEAAHEYGRDLSGLYAAACDRYRAAEEHRGALGKALLRYSTGDDCGCSDGSPDQPPTMQCAFCEAQAALRSAGPLEEGS